jgi:hypothetical protein
MANRSIGALRATSTRLRNLAELAYLDSDKAKFLAKAIDVEGRLLLLGATVLPPKPPRTEPANPKSVLAGYRASRTKILAKLERLHPRYTNKRKALEARLAAVELTIEAIAEIHSL